MKELENILYRISSNIATSAKQRAPIATGNLKEDIKVRPNGALSFAIGNTKQALYARYVHTGTGLYGPKKRRIRPKKAKALNTPYGPRASIKGQKAQPYLQQGLEAYLSSSALKNDLKFAEDQAGKALKKRLERQLKGMGFQVR